MVKNMGGVDGRERVPQGDVMRELTPAMVEHHQVSHRDVRDGEVAAAHLQPWVLCARGWAPMPWELCAGAACEARTLGF